MIDLQSVPTSKQSSSDVGRRQRKWIEQVRRLLEPTPVKLNKVPGWFRLALLRGYGCHKYESTSGYILLPQIASNQSWGWLDHWGSTDYYGRSAFVSEPYGLGEDDLTAIADMCWRCDLRCEISSNSWRYPGATVRVLIFQKTDAESVGPAHVAGKNLATVPETILDESVNANRMRMLKVERHTKVLPC
jgi:hypothetical protein